jgi:two-component system, OmpR family, phosphate regulon sensor histidine kinase PhoR
MTSWPAAASSAAPLPEHGGARTVRPAASEPSPKLRLDRHGSPHDTVSRRVGRLVASILGLLILVGGAASFTLLTSANTVNRLSSGYTPAGDANNAALIYMLDAETGIRGYALTGQRSYLRPYRDDIGKILPTIDIVSTTLGKIGDHTLDTRIAAQRRAARAWIDGVGVRAAANLAAARRVIRAPTSRTRFDTFRTASAAVSAAIAASRAKLSDRSETERDLVLPFIGAVIVALGLAVFVALRTARGVSRPLTAVWQTVRQLETGDLSARADEFSGPAEVRELAAAVNSLAVERRRTLAAQRADDEVRREVRGVTSAIRIGQDAQAMARALVAGLGRTYDVDRVWLQTFDEQRVAVISEQWRRGRRVAHIAPSTAELTELRWLANRLWHAGSVVGIADHSVPPTDADAYLLRAPHAVGSKASAVVAVGEGGKAIGLLWLSTMYETRAWTSAELGLLQHVGAELAQNLVQNHVLIQQRDAMRRLREADEAKTALVSTVSHELRTPLTSIIGYLDVLLDMDEADVPTDVSEMLKVIDRNAHRLRALIEDLLTQSQIEAGRRLVELSRVDLVDVLKEVDDTIEPLADNAHLGFEIELPERGELVIDADPRQLGQAITNLAANAVKFTPRGGQVVVSAAREPSARGAHDAGAWAGDEVVIRVRDTGIGIPTDEVPQLFDRFFRATNARKAVIQGTGLGLAIVAEIVAQHHGTVEVESELGIGTTFVIRLPLTSDETVVEPEETDQPGTVDAG